MRKPPPAPLNLRGGPREGEGDKGRPCFGKFLGERARAHRGWGGSWMRVEGTWEGQTRLLSPPTALEVPWTWQGSQGKCF